MYGLDACSKADVLGKDHAGAQQYTPLLDLRSLIKLSHSSAVYGKVGISDVRASDAARQFSGETRYFSNLPARAFMKMTLSSFKAVVEYWDAVAGNISTWVQ
jgi:hypothetical protein